MLCGRWLTCPVQEIYMVDELVLKEWRSPQPALALLLSCGDAVAQYNLVFWLTYTLIKYNEWPL